MAYLSNYLTDEEKRKQAEAPRSTSGVVDSVVTAPTATNGSPAPTEEKATPGTGFVNLQQYLDMNKDEGARLANEANKSLVNEADSYVDQTKNVVTESADDFSKASGSSTAKEVASGLAKDASKAKDAAEDFLGSAYSGPKAGDLYTDLGAAKGSLTGSLSKVDDAATVQANLQNTYGKTGPYTQGFSLLDKFLVGGTQSGQQALGAIKSKADVVDNSYDSAKTALEKAEKEAKAKLAENKQAVINAAKDTKKDLVNSASEKVEELNQGIGSKVNASEASFGDVLSKDQALDLDALDVLLKEQGDWYSKTFNAGEDKPQDEAAGGGGGDSSTDLPPILKANAEALGAAAKAGADISNAVKTINEPNVETFNSLGKFRDNPTAENAFDLLTKAGLAPFVTAYNSVQVASDLVNQLDGRVTKELDKAFPGVGAGLGTVLNKSRGPAPLAPNLPKAPKLKTLSDGAKAAQMAAAKKIAKPIGGPIIPKWTKNVSLPSDAKNYFSADGKFVEGGAVSLVDKLNPKNMVALLQSAPNELGKEIKSAIAAKAAGMELGLLNQLNRALDKAGVGGSVKKSVQSALKGFSDRREAQKAAGKAWVEATAAAQKAVTDAANKAAEEAKKLGGQVSNAGKNAVNYVSARVPKLKKPKF